MQILFSFLKAIYIHRYFNKKNSKKFLENIFFDEIVKLAFKSNIFSAIKTSNDNELQKICLDLYQMSWLFLFILFL